MRTRGKRTATRGKRTALLTVSVAALTLALGAALAHATKGGDSFIGITGTPPSGAEADGGAFNNPLDIAANHETGQIFVVDENNHRVQRFDSEGDFELAWGRNVSESATTGNDSSAGGFAFEVCTETADCQGSSSGAAVGGYSGSRGGMFDNPVGIAVDPDTGDVFVIDRGNRRVQRFSFDDNGTPGDSSDDTPVFEAAFGSNVVPEGGAADEPGPSERQRVALKFDLSAEDQSITGTFTLRFDGQTTAQISWPPTAASIQGALEGLSNIAPGDISVTEPTTFFKSPDDPRQFTVRWNIAFSGAHADTNVPSVSLDKFGLTADGLITPQPTTPTEGNSNPEVCTIASECQPGLAGQSAGAFSSGDARPPITVTPDGAPGEGSVFVGDPGNRRLMEFDIDGSFNRAWGFAVDSGPTPYSNGEEFEICTLASSCEAGSSASASGSSNGLFAGGGAGQAPSPVDIAVEADGTVYAVNASGGGGQVLRFDSTVPGEDPEAAAELLLPNPLRTTANEGPLRPGAGRGLEVNPETGNLLYLLDGSEDTLVQELDISEEPPTEADLHMENSGDQPVNGLGLLHGAGKDLLYVSASGGAIEHRLLVLDNDGAGPIDLTIEPATELAPHEATLNGTVNANGPTIFAVEHNFQYSLDGEEWTTVPASDGPFSDAEAHEVDDTVEGLEANTEYKARLIATRAFNGGFAETTPEVAFTTLPAPPVAETLLTSLRTNDSVTLIGRLNPEGSPTDWRFEWGEDESYGNSTPVEVAIGGKPRIVSAEIEGLDPETTYHYRIVADNGIEEAPGDTTIEGEDFSVTTRAAIPPAPERAYEMVTPPFKAPRTITQTGSPPQNNNHAMPSLDGERVIWETQYMPLSDDVRSSGDSDGRISERTPEGWVDHTLNTLPIAPPFRPDFVAYLGSGGSGDLRTISWQLRNGHEGGAELLPNEGSLNVRDYTRRDGTGTVGFTNWVNNTDTQVCPFFDCSKGNNSSIIITPGSGATVINDNGSAMARWGHYRELGEDPETPANEDPSGEQQLHEYEGGYTAYLVRVSDPDDLPAAPKQLIAECTGEGASATELPSRLTSGPTSLITTRSCKEGNVVSRRGAVGGGVGPRATALANDGNRVFFTAPDPRAENVPSTCTTDTGPDTDCPPQLYVRQYGSEGEEFVRWVSRSRSEAAGDGSYEGPMIPLQRFSQLDGGAVFQGASRDGRYVYFQTKMPLVPDDPNGGESITAGKASSDSWDLYRYELPADRSIDPDEGKLLRISGGPEGGADPATNGTNGDGGALRYHSDDGKRVYFVTTSPISGMDATVPAGGTTTPSGEPANGEAHNLYLFDDHQTGADRWRFIAAMPQQTISAGRSSGVGACATYSETLFGNGLIGNCFRGTRDGSRVMFVSEARLTTDDNDNAGDIFLYDARVNELTRVSAPTVSSDPYQCLPPDILCNAQPRSGNEPAQFVLGSLDGSRGWGGGRYLGVAEDDQGVVSVFFESRSRLLPEDVNGKYTDVYEWREGKLSLISRGTGEHYSTFSGNSIDGEDVFFFTSDRIDPRELEERDFDTYNARVGGGFPYTPPPTPCDVLAFECEREATMASATRRAASLLIQPSENVTSRKGKVRRRTCGRAKLRRGKRCVRKAALARRRCRKLHGRAKRHCIRKQLRRLNRVQKRERKRAAGSRPRRSR